MRAKIVDGIVYSPYPDLEDLRDVSLYAFLTQRLQKYGHKTAMVHGQDKVSYSEFLERLKVMASGFHSHGIGTGDRVLVHVENDIDSFVAACSIPLTGATLVTSDVTFNEEELLDHTRRTDATHLLTGKAYVDLFDNLSTVVNFKSRFSLTDVPGYINVTNFANDRNLKHTDFPNSQVGVKFVCHSTGTTGISKTIEITEATFLSQISCREKFQLATPEDVCIGGGNISFYVCFTYVFFIISIGGTIVLLDKYSPVPDVFTALRDHQVNLVHGTPTKILEIVHEAERLGQSFPLVKKFTTLGTPMTEMARSAILAACAPSELRSCYGMTEVSGYLAAPPCGEITAGGGGFPVPGARMKVVDPVSGAVLSHNRKGEVLFHTPHIMVGYYKNPEETASFTTDDGWIRTGDLGYYNEDGRLFVLGRVKAAVSANNVWAGLPQIEECLSFHPSIIEAAVMPNPEFPAAIIVIRKDEIPSERLAEKIKTFVKERLPTAQPLDGGIFFVDAIPRSGFGKIKRRLLSEIIPTLRRMDAPCCKSNACAK
uniref:Putative acyl-coa synthetase n=1 Tax=Rhipicephalus microplus TaxID=6941 RepID=A0A6M2CII4_RHIMP